MPKKNVAPSPASECDDGWVELEPPPRAYGYFWEPSGIQRLKENCRVKTAAELHPSLAFIDKGVLAHLRRAREIFQSKGFMVHEDPENRCGDGKSWALRAELTDKLPRGVNPLDLAIECQAECVEGAPRPLWEGSTVVVPLWRSGGNNVQRAPVGIQHSAAPPRGLIKQPAFRSPRRKKIAALLREEQDASNHASDREILAHLRENHPAMIPDTWNIDEELAFKTFTKVRRAMGITKKSLSTATLPATATRAHSQ